VIPVPVFSALSARRRASRHARESKVSLAISPRLVGKLTRGVHDRGDHRAIIEVECRAESTAVRRPLTRDRGSREDPWILLEKFECLNFVRARRCVAPKSDVSSKRSTIESSALCLPSRESALRVEQLSRTCARSREIARNSRIH